MRGFWVEFLCCKFIGTQPIVANQPPFLPPLSFRWVGLPVAKWWWLALFAYSIESLWIWEQLVEVLWWNPKFSISEMYNLLFESIDYVGIWFFLIFFYLNTRNWKWLHQCSTFQVLVFVFAKFGLFVWPGRNTTNKAIQKVSNYIRCLQAECCMEIYAFPAKC